MKFKKHRIFSTLIASILLTTSLGGCYDDEYGLDANNPTTIKVWHYYNGVQQTQFDNMINKFNETVGYEKGIIVEGYASSSISELNEKTLSSLRNEVGSESAPNIFAAYPETAYVADSLGRVVDMRQYLTEDEISEYVKGYIEEGIFSDDGALKIFPIAKSTEVMILNLTDWQTFSDNTGISVDDLKTWEGLAEVSERYYDYTDGLTPDIPNDGKSFFGRDSAANYMTIGAKQLGYEYIKVVDGKNTLDIDKDAIRKLWDNYYVPYVKGYYTSQSRFRSDDAKIGKIIALIGSTTGSAYYPSEVTLDDEYTYPIEGLVLPVPNFEGYDPYIVQQGAGFVVVKSSEAEEYASSIFLQWLTDTERNIEFTIGSGYLPVKEQSCNFETIMEVNDQSDIPVDNQILLDTIEVAIDEVNCSNSYTSKPYEHSSEVRDLLSTVIHDEAVSTYEEVSQRIANGESRDDVIDEYTNDTAFETWFENFQTQLIQIAIDDD